MTVRLLEGDCLDVMRDMIARGEKVHAVVCDPPYHLTSIVKRFGAEDAALAQSDGPTGVYARSSRGFMGKTWDGGDIAMRAETWRLCWELLPPGGHLSAFGGTRTWHRIAAAIEDAGFEIRDTIAWMYGTGFPKSHDVSKGIDAMVGAGRPVVAIEKVRDIRNGHGRALGEGIHASGRDGPTYFDRAVTAPGSAAAADWQGWGTALKPAFEPIIVARKPLAGTVAQNVLAHGTGALNIDGCRVPATDKTPAPIGQYGGSSVGPVGHKGVRNGSADHLGRWPANVVHDGSDGVEAAFAAFGDRPGQIARESSSSSRKDQNVYGAMRRGSGGREPREDSGSASRFFYSAKASKEDRAGSKHPTVKPIALLRWLVRMVTPPGGVVLDPFAGSGTTGAAAMAEGMDAVLIEREAEYQADIRRRLGLPEPRVHAAADLL